MKANQILQYERKCQNSNKTIKEYADKISILSIQLNELDENYRKMEEKYELKLEQKDKELKQIKTEIASEVKTN